MTTAAGIAVRDGFVEEMFRAVAAILEDRPTIVNDLKLEAAAFLCMARQGKRVEPRFFPTRHLDPESRRRLGQARHIRTLPIPTSHLGTRRRSPCCSFCTWSSRCAEGRRRRAELLNLERLRIRSRQSNRSHESGPALRVSLCVSLKTGLGGDASAATSSGVAGDVNRLSSGPK
jgi:hypothetical protein